MSVPESNVENLLKNAKFAHVATSSPETNQPNVSLMNYVYLNKNDLFNYKQDEDKTLSVTSQDQENNVISSYILFSVKKCATSFENIASNPKVSILIHDWITAKSSFSIDHPSAGNPGDFSPLLQMLKSMNQNELSTISATLNGEAILVDDTEARKYYRQKLLDDYPDAKVFIEGEDNVIVLIKLQHCKIVDSNNNRKKY